MAGNFQFTGAPKPAMYNPKGLDFFLAAPSLRAQVKGAAIQLSQQAQVSSEGVHSSDMEKATMLATNNQKKKEESLDYLMNSDAVTTTDIQTLSRNITDSRDSQQKILRMQDNAKRIQAHENQLQAAGINSKNPIYYNKVAQANRDSWNGSYDDEGNYREYSPVGVPREMNIQDEYDKAMGLASANMTPEERAEVNFSEDIELVRQETPEGIQMVWKVTKPMDKFGNTNALSQARADFLNDLNNSKTDIGAYAEFMGPEYLEGISATLDNRHELYQREKEIASITSLEMGDFIDNEELGLNGPLEVMSQSVSHNSNSLFFEDRGRVSGVSLESDDITSKTGDYSKGASNLINNTYGVKDMSVTQMRSTLAGPTTDDGFTNWLKSAVIQPGTPDYEYSTDYNRLAKNLKELESLVGKDASILPGEELSYDDKGEGAIVNPEVHELRSKIYEDIATLQNGWVNMTQKNTANYYTNDLKSVNRKTGKVTEHKKEVYQGISSDIGNRLVIRAVVGENNRYVSTSSNLTDKNGARGENGTRLEQNVQGYLSNEGKTPRVDNKGRESGGGFLTTPKVTSIDGRDIFGEGMYSGNVPPTGGATREMQDMLRFDKYEDGQLVHYYVSNRGDVATPINSTTVTYIPQGSDKAETGSISNVIGDLEVGGSVAVASSKGDLTVVRTEVGYRIYKPDGSIATSKNHFKTSEKVYNLVKPQ